MPSSESPVSLEQYAGISAALALKLPLSAVLAQEQVEEAAFREGELHWRQTIAESLETQLEYTQKLRIAEDCLARSLSPIDEDAGAWVSLLGAIATSLDPNALLTELGISLQDVGRLGRVWKARAIKDPALAANMVELAKTPNPPTSIRAGAIELRPFPWTPKSAPVLQKAVPALTAESAPESVGAPVVQQIGRAHV